MRRFISPSRESLGTKAVRSPAGHSLSLESTTSSMSLLAPAGVDIISQSGHVHLQVHSTVQCSTKQYSTMSAQAHRDLVFRARGHNSLLRIDAGTVLLPGLPALARQPRRRNPTNETVYQLCICRWVTCHVSSVATCHVTLLLNIQVGPAVSGPAAHPLHCRQPRVQGDTLRIPSCNVTDIVDMCFILVLTSFQLLLNISTTQRLYCRE